jgi:asparagine synthetase B (glutamine-hydrolysing)
MCGIFGYIHRDRIPNLENIDLHAILQHRGPDDAGWLLHDGKVVKTGQATLPDRAAKMLLLHKRLSILDLTRIFHPIS